MNDWVTLHGVRCYVPARYFTHYPQRYKDEIATTVLDLKNRCGNRLVSVHVARVVKTRTRLRVDWRYTTKAPHEE